MTYEINAYIAEAQQLLAIKSNLLQNIQDKFNEAGVEIMSPAYHALRDGNRETIPESYLPPTYEPGGFRIFPLNITRENK